MWVLWLITIMTYSRNSGLYYGQIFPLSGTSSGGGLPMTLTFPTLAVDFTAAEQK